MITGIIVLLVTRQRWGCLFDVRTGAAQGDYSRSYKVFVGDTLGCTRGDICR